MWSLVSERFNAIAMGAGVINWVIDLHSTIVILSCGSWIRGYWYENYNEVSQTRDKNSNISLI